MEFYNMHRVATRVGGRTHRCTNDHTYVLSFAIDANPLQRSQRVQQRAESTANRKKQIGFLIYTQR